MAYDGVEPDIIFLDALADAVGSLERVYPDGRTVDALLDYLKNRTASGVEAARLTQIEALEVLDRFDRFATAARHYRDLRFQP